MFGITIAHGAVDTKQEYLPGRWNSRYRLGPGPRMPGPVAQSTQGTLGISSLLPQFQGLQVGAVSLQVTSKGASHRAHTLPALSRA